MSTIAYNGLIEFLCATFSPEDLRRISEELVRYAQIQEQPLKPYTMEELNSRIDEAERQIAAGLTIDSEDMFRELEEDFAKEEQFEFAEAV